VTASDVTQIIVNNRKVGIIGLERTIRKMAHDYAGKPDGEIQHEMVRRLTKNNYIPDRAIDNYGRAFVQEFKKHLGLDYEEEAAPRSLEVKILGMGCARCDWMKQEVINALAELNIPADVEHVTEVREIAKYGIMGSPALIINGTARCVGSVPAKEEIKRWLTESTDE
jgi:small redox-active disulfide protein 2